tara:strand:- start:966 stop:1862 length:897 start_codon:yes stop_codon:yes gene_type:complete
MNKILITGGNGFVARSLYENFTNSYFCPLRRNIYAPSRAELDLLDADKVYEYLKENKFDVVVHTATYDAAPQFSSKDMDKVLEYNLKMFFNVARARYHYGKMIYFGSGAEAGRENWIPQMREEYISWNVPADQYGLSKHTMNEIAENSRNIYNLRVFGLFGKFDDWRYRFISNACCKVVLGLPITIRNNARFDYLHIDDLAEVIKWFMNNEPKRRSYNVCSGQVHAYEAIATKILNTASKKLDIIINNSDLLEYSGDNRCLLKELDGFSYSQIDGQIEKLYNWYDANKEIIDKEQFVY